MLIKDKVVDKKADNSAANWGFVNNAIAFLFDDIRYKINGVEVDRTKNVSITTIIKSVLSVRRFETNTLRNSCWLGPGEELKVDGFIFHTPSAFVGFCQRCIVVNSRQELVLLLSASGNNAIISTDAVNVDVTISSVYWRMPHINLSDTYRLNLNSMIKK